MKVRRVPIRSCVVCRQTSQKAKLLRVVRAPEKDGGAVAVDPTGRANGRGAYICAALVCIEKAAKQKKFERTLSAPTPVTLMDDLKALVKIVETSVREVSHAEIGLAEVKASVTAEPTGATEK